MRRLLILIVFLGQFARADLLATFSQGDSGDTRHDRLPALRVEKGSPPTPFLKPGPFEVSWTGHLVVPKRLRLHFSFEGDGDATLLIDGETVLEEQGALGSDKSERLRLNPGEHEITLRYRSRPDGSAHFRLFWEERSFPRQSIPPTAFKPLDSLHDPKRLGRELFATHHCAKCHTPQTGLGASPMPETQEIAPLLANSGNRLNEAWLAHWIADPKALRPHAKMPKLLNAGNTSEQAADLAAYLMTLKIIPTPPAPDPSGHAAGGKLFHKLGCVACHSMPDAGTPDPARVPLRHVAAKFQAGALVEFLKKPDQWYPHSGMPDFALADDEAEAIAAWLLKESEKTELAPIPTGDPGRGEQLAGALNCGSCHAGLPLRPTPSPSLEDIFKADWKSSGCLNPEENKPAQPEYTFNEQERAALAAFGKTGSEPLKCHVPTEYAGRKLNSLRCTSCHALDETPALLDTTHAESQELVDRSADQRLDQSRPHLTFIGEMLHSSYMSKAIDGRTSPKPRPWLDMRMPAFHSHATGLADGLARLHGISPGEPAPIKPDPELVRIGKELAGGDGFGCVTCHATGSKKATAAFEVEGVNFTLCRDRLRKEWFMRWMDNPASVTPGSKMPRYSENGESQRGDILEGDAERQFEALWHYLQSL